MKKLTIATLILALILSVVAVMQVTAQAPFAEQCPSVSCTIPGNGDSCSNFRIVLEFRTDKAVGCYSFIQKVRG